MFRDGYGTLPVEKAALTWQIALVATGGLLGSELVLGVISLMHPVGLLWAIFTGNLADPEDICLATLAAILDLCRL